MMDTAPPTTHAEPGREVRRVLEDFVAAPDTTGRLTTLVRLVRATRVDESRDGQRTLVGRFLDEVELPGELRDRFGAALAVAG